jgi:3-phosphoshikimate 1-carboxyvinyltransferase
MTLPPQRFVAAPGRQVGGQTSVPGDKSISHRALMLGAVADGSTRISGFLRSDDCLATMSALRALGIRIEEHGEQVEVFGEGGRGLSSPAGELDLGNSGTAIRLLAGLIAGRGVDATLTGDASLRARPMQRIIGPLSQMGARIEASNGSPPIRIRESRTLHGIEYSMPVSSAQVKSAILLAALAAHGRTTVHSPGTCRDHTERMLLVMGIDIRSEGGSVSIDGPAIPAGIDIVVPGDFSSAAFMIVAGCLAATDGLTIRGVGINPSRTGLLTILGLMGAKIEIANERTIGGEPVADILVRRSALHGVDVPSELVPNAIDEFPVLFVAAAAARGKTCVSGAAELRTKESDRIGASAQALRTLGLEVDERPDGMTVHGGAIAGGTVDSHGDHRIAMSMAVASLVSAGPIEILDTGQVATSFPDFAATAARIGLDLEVIGGAAA